MPKIIEAKRDYIVTDRTFQKCDMCKRIFQRVFELTPSKKTHGFDTLMLCRGCIDKCDFLFNVDVQDLIAAGGVEEWQKKN